MDKERVRAIIVEQGKILLIKRIFSDRTYWVFPGGGVEEDEDVTKALERECLEELGVVIEVQNLFAQEVSGKKETEGEIEYFYIVKIIEGKPGKGSGPEYKQNSKYSGEYELIWEEVNLIKDIDLRPTEVRDKVSNYFQNSEKLLESVISFSRTAS